MLHIHCHSLQHALISVFIGQVGRWGLGIKNTCIYVKIIVRRCFKASRAGHLCFTYRLCDEVLQRCHDFSEVADVDVVHIRLAYEHLSIGVLRGDLCGGVGV